MVYTPNEIYDLLLKVDCIEDTQRIADYINENKEHYSGFDQVLFKIALMTYVNIFV